jgi:CheY-like chemotaxis protein
MLQNWRMAPSVAAGATAALDTLKVAKKQKDPFSLAILDGHMPEMDGFTLASRMKRNPALSKTKIIMLTSAVDRSDSERCRKIRVAAHLNKPVKQSELLDTIVTIFASRARPKKTAKHAQSTEPAQRLNVLVAEDNPVNQQLMRELLKRRAYAVKVANNGNEALELLAKNQFDIVLMDIQMPIMGGLEATTAIREQEKMSGAHIPIVATSAHAMASDRNRAIEAGMDAYLIKPIRPNELYETIHRLTGRELHIDEQSLLDGLGGSRAILKKLVGIFLKDSPRMMKQIRNAIATGNGDSIAAAAHSLKGAAGNFGPNPVFNTAKQLEQSGKAHRTGEASALFKRLETDLVALRKRLQEFKK